MNRLNGWQRIWVVLMALWTVVVAGFAYNVPTHVYHYIEYSKSTLYARMDPVVRQRMGVPAWEGEDCTAEDTYPGILEESVSDLPGLSTPVRLCFAVGERKTPESFFLATKLSKSEMDRIKAEYARAYRDELRDRKIAHFTQMAAIWLVPGAALYLFGWAIGWILRGFKTA